MASRRAAFFDIDRTLVGANTGNLYMRWRFRNGQATVYEVLRVMKWMAQYTLGVKDTSSVTAKALTLVEGMEERLFVDECRTFFSADVAPRISAAAREEVIACRDAGFECVILSAATPYVAQAVASEFAIPSYLCSSLEVVDGRFTGQLSQPLCYGSRKVEVAEDWAAEHDIDLTESAFYSDSYSDLPMLKRVGIPVVVNPDPRLRWHAKREGWPIREWRPLRLPRPLEAVAISR